MKRFLLLLLASLCLVGTSRAQCIAENFIDLETGTPGNVVDTATLLTSTHGYSGGSFGINDSGGQIIYSTAGNQPLSYPTGTLCGNSTNYPAGTGSVGLQITGTGVSGTHNITYTLPAQLQLTSLQTAVWYCMDFGPSDTSTNPDTLDMHSSSGNFAAINNLSVGGTQRYFKLETGDGYGASNIISVPSGGCNPTPPAMSTWLKLILTLGVSGGASHDLKVFDVTGAMLGELQVTSTNTTPAITSYIGCPGNPTSQVASGKHCYFDSWQIAAPSVALGPNCTGASPTWTATPDQVSVQTCLNNAIAGDTVNIGFGSTAWYATVSKTVTGNINVVGKTACIAGCAAGSEGVGLAFTDGTTIKNSVNGNSALLLKGCSTLFFCSVSNLTLNNPISEGVLTGMFQIQGVHGQRGAHVFNLNVTNSGGTVFVGAFGFGVLDHILYHGASGEYSFSSFTGDFASGGYLNWQDPTHLGSNEVWDVEDSNFTPFGVNGVTDGYFGCKITGRHLQINGGGGFGIVHGADSGGFRGCPVQELYNLTLSSLGVSNPPFASRGGVLLYHHNVHQGTAQWNGIQLAYFRSTTDPSVCCVASPWGFAPSIATWTPTVQGGSNVVLNPRASAYQTTHTYSGNSIVTFGGCNMLTVAGGTTGSSTPSCPGFTSTVTDSGGVVWQNIGGGTGAPPGTTGTNAGFLSTDNETTCISGPNCNRFLDGIAGYPPRDGIGVLHGQVVSGDYQWSNSGVQAPSNFWGTSPDCPYCQLGRDYFNATPAGYTSYTYPDPLNAGSSGGGTNQNGSCTENTSVSATSSTVRSMHGGVTENLTTTASVSGPGGGQHVFACHP